MCVQYSGLTAILSRARAAETDGSVNLLVR
jgi:hypothetical protein